MQSIRAIRKQRTRDALIQAAIGVFSEKGFLGARTSDVAEAAGVAHGTVFLHFPTAEALVAAVIRATGLRIAARLHELVEEGAGVRQVLAAHLRGIGEFEAFYARLAVEGPLLPEEPRLDLLAIDSALSFHLGLAMDRERATGALRDLEPHFVFNLWMGLVDRYLANRGLFAPGASVVERRGEELLESFMGLVRSGQGGSL